MTRPLRLNGRDINVAANATRGVLDAVLGEHGYSFTEWAVLNNLSTEPLRREPLTGKLVALGVNDAAAVSKAIEGLHERGFLATGEDGKLSLTTKGTTTVSLVSARTTEIGDRLYEGIEPEDLATTKRVLALVTERANSVRAGR